MAARTWVLLGLAAAVFAGLSRVPEPLGLTHVSGARAAEEAVAGWHPTVRRRAVTALVVDLLAFVPLYTALGVALADEAGGDALARIGLAGVLAGAAADVVEDVTALAYVRTRSARLVPAMRWAGRAKHVASVALVALLGLAWLR